MYLRPNRRFKDGKEHRYWSIVESKRCAGGKVVQRQVLYLGEINDSQQEAWCRVVEAFDERAQQTTQLALFPADRPLPDHAEGHGVQIRLGAMQLHRPRQWGACWLACQLYEQLELDRFWAARLPDSREGTCWSHILETLVCYRLIDPGSEWRLHRLWFEQSAMGDLLGGDFALVELHQQALAREVHARQLRQSRPQPLQLPLSHGALLVDARPALGEHVKVVVLGQQLHLDARPHLVPGQADERLFQLAEASLGGSHQIGDGRIGLPHFGQHLFGGDAAVHHPDALGLAVLRLDLRKEGAQRRLVGGVAGENFVGERKSVGRHDQRDDHLHAVGALVAAVAVPALVAIVARRIGFEIRAGQVVEKDVEAGAEQILPTPTQMREQRRFVLDKLVEAAIERILLDQRNISAEQIAHGALLEPQPADAIRCLDR